MNFIIKGAASKETEGETPTGISQQKSGTDK